MPGPGGEGDQGLVGLVLVVGGEGEPAFQLDGVPGALLQQLQQQHPRVLAFLPALLQRQLEGLVVEVVLAGHEHLRLLLRQRAAQPQHVLLGHQVQVLEDVQAVHEHDHFQDGLAEVVRPRQRVCQLSYALHHLVRLVLRSDPLLLRLLYQSLPQHNSLDIFVICHTSLVFSYQSLQSFRFLLLTREEALNSFQLFRSRLHRHCQFPIVFFDFGHEEIYRNNG